MILASVAFLKVEEAKVSPQDPIGYVGCNYFHVVQGQGDCVPYCLMDVKMENPSSISKEYFRYAMREVEVKSLPIFFRM